MHQFQLAFVLVLCLALQSMVAAKLSFSPGNRRQAAASVGRHENVKAEGRFTSQFINQLNTLKGGTSSSTCPPSITTLTYPQYTSTPTSTSTSPTTTSPTSTTSSPTGTSTLPVTTTNTSRSAPRSFKNRFNDLDDGDHDDDDDLFLDQNFANNWVDSNIDDDDVDNNYDGDNVDNGSDLASTDEQNLINGRRHNELGRAARANPSQWQLQQLRQRNRRLRQQQMQRRRSRQRQSNQRRRRQQKARNARRRRAIRRRNMRRQRKASVRHRTANNRRLRRFMQNGGSNRRRIVRVNV